MSCCRNKIVNNLLKSLNVDGAKIYKEHEFVYEKEDDKDKIIKELNDKIKELEEQIKNLEANCLEDYKEFTAFQNGLFYIRLKKDEKIYYPK